MPTKIIWFSLIWIGSLVACCCANEASLQLRIPDLEGGQIPVRFTCQGNNVSPALVWSGGPNQTKSYALTLIDKDAPHGDFTHWIIYNMPASHNHLKEGLSRDSELSNGARQGRNSFHRVGYDGPCPPSGKVHRYIFTLYALDMHLVLRAGALTEELHRAMQGHILEETQVQGTYINSQENNREESVAFNRPDIALER